MHLREGPRLLDNHGSAVCDEVWALYAKVLERRGPIATLIEWDTHIPELDQVLDQADLARAALGRAPASPARATMEAVS